MDPVREGLRYEILFGGAKSTSKLLYLECNKCLYVRTCAVNETTDRFVCYQNKLTGCNSSVIKIGDVVQATRNFEHKCHGNHENMRKEFTFNDTLKRKSTELNPVVGDQVRMVPSCSIYNHQMETYVQTNRFLLFVKIFKILYFLSVGRATSGVLLESMERHLCNIYDNIFPKSPETVGELEKLFEDGHVMKSYGMCHQYGDRSKKSEVFFRGIVKESGFSSVIFASPLMIKMIEENIEPMNRNYFVDGNFKIVPMGPYSQLLIIHISYLDLVSSN